MKHFTNRQEITVILLPVGKPNISRPYIFRLETDYCLHCIVGLVREEETKKKKEKVISMDSPKQHVSKGASLQLLQRISSVCQGWE